MATQGQTRPTVKEWAYCRNHPFVKANWKCMDCGREFCEDCVTPLRHSMSHLNRSAVCPECKGRCIDFQHIKNVADERREAEKAKRKTAIKLLLGISALVGVGLPLFMLKAPTEILIVFFLISGTFLLLANLYRLARRLFGFGRLRSPLYHVHPAILIVLGIIVILFILLLNHFPSWGLK